MQQSNWKIKMQSPSFVNVAIFLLLACSSSTAQLSPQGSRLAQTLGMLLGLPLDIEAPPANSSTAPEFLVDVYNCWSTLRPTESRATCLPSSASKKSLEDVDEVRSIKGIVMNNSTPGVFSHSPEPRLLPSSISLKFNMSMVGRTKEDIRYAYIRISRELLGTSDLENIKNRCDVKSGVELQLYIKVNKTENSQDVFSLLTTATVSEHDLQNKKWVDFGDITRQFKTWMDKSSSMEILEARVIVGGSCYNVLEPAELGIDEDSENIAFIVSFSKSEGTHEKIVKVGLAELAAEATANRRRRETDHTAVADTPPASNFSNHHPCRKHLHMVSFADLGWNEYIFSPASYEANFCAGTCDFLLNSHHNTTKHSYIQSLASLRNPELVPPPCCAPHELQNLTVIYWETKESFKTQIWADMTVSSCGCK